MSYSELKTWLWIRLVVPERLTNVCIGYVLFIMVSFRKHTLEQAAKHSGLNKAQFSRFLKNHHKDAVANLNHLSKKQAKKLAKFCKGLAKGVLPWQIAIIIDATIQRGTAL